MTRSVKGTFRSKARRLTSTTSPSSSVGRIDPDGIGFQSATAVRKSPKSRMKTMKPRLLRIHVGKSRPLLGPELMFRCLRPGLRGFVLAAKTWSVPDSSSPALFAGDPGFLDHDRDFGEVHRRHDVRAADAGNVGELLKHLDADPAAFALRIGGLLKASHH